MDIVRLAIVYETSQAAAKLQELDQQLNRVQSSTKTLNSAAGSASQGLRGLERPLTSIATEAAGIPGPIGHAASSLLRFGIGGEVTIAVLAGTAAIAGAWKLLQKPIDDARDAAKKAGEQFIETLAAVSKGAQISLEITKIGLQIDQLREKQQKFGIVEAARALATGVVFGPQAAIKEAADRFQVYQRAIDDASRSIDILIGQLHKSDDALGANARRAAEAAEHLRELARANAAQQRAAEEFIRERGRIQQELVTNLLPPGLIVPAGGTHDLGLVRQGIPFDTGGIEKALEIAGLKFGDLGNASVGLKSKFDIAGKSVLDFVGALAQAIGVLFPNDPGLGYAVLGIGQAIISSTHGSTGSGSKGTKRGEVVSEPSVTTNVNFNVAAMDQQGVARWVQQNGPTIAAEISRQADRSRAIRKRWWRG